MEKEEIYISVDIETDGPIPGDYSMLSLGAAAFKSDGTLLSTFSVNLKCLIGATQDKDTMEWWSKNQEAYLATRENTIEPKLAMGQFVSWVNEQKGTPVCVCYPSGFDFTWVYWYMIHFGCKSPFSFSALDIKSYACAVMKSDYRKSTKKYMPKKWFPETKHSHVAVEDAIEQGELFINILKHNINGQL